MHPQPRSRPSPSSFRRALRLAEWRLRSAASWRIARAVSIVASCFFATCAVYLGVKGLGAEVAHVTARAAVAIGWIAATIVGLWNASDRASADESDGIAALAACHGAGPRELVAARAMVALVGVAALVFVCSFPPAIASIATAPAWRMALARALSLLPLLAFACGTGLVGALASVCGAIAPRHGRSLFTALVLLPWALQTELFPSRAGVGSLPGVLGFLADLVSSVGAGA